MINPVTILQIGESLPEGVGRRRWRSDEVLQMMRASGLSPTDEPAPDIMLFPEPMLVTTTHRDPAAAGDATRLAVAVDATPTRMAAAALAVRLAPSDIRLD